MAIKGTSDNDDLAGTAAADIFNLKQGGDDTADGLGGNDTFRMAGAFNALDAIDGGDDADKVSLIGDYSLGLTFGAATMLNVEALRLGGAFDYDLTTHDATVAAGERLTVNAAPLGVGHQLTFDGSAETDGKFVLIGSDGDDALTGGARGDRFLLTHDGADTANGGGGNDRFVMGAAFNAGDSIDGGGGFDAVVLAGDYSGGYTFAAGNLVSIEKLTFQAGNEYNLTTVDANVAAGATLAVDGSLLGVLDSLIFDGSAETDGNFEMRGGISRDYLIGGAGNDSFEGHLELDHITSGAGADVFIYRADPGAGAPTAAAMSTSLGGCDLIDDANMDSDVFDFDFAVTSFDGTATITGVTFTNFDNKANATGGGHAANEAWVVSVESADGALDGHAYLCVDVDGDGAYNHGTDLLIDITGSSGAFDDGDFI